MIQYQHGKLPCMRDGDLKKIVLRRSNVPGGVIYGLFNGCEFMCGLDACNYCIDTVNRRVLRVFSEPIDFTRDIFVNTTQPESNNS